ncbi:MAG: thiamine phosphate synthase, partial [Chloroflexi bacterium]|nr:thiamine phosphate synthase [Chloroflexota bacterium]
LYDLALKLRQITAGRAAFVVNDRLDVALACGADGVQLGEEALPLQAARKVAGAGRLLIGRSVHSVEGAVAAQREGADFLVVGTIFPTGSHPGGPTAGLGLLDEVHAVATLPFLAIGGVDTQNAPSVMARGAAGAAVISAILGGPGPRAAAEALRHAMAVALRSAGSVR